MSNISRVIYVILSALAYACLVWFFFVGATGLSFGYKIFILVLMLVFISFGQEFIAVRTLKKHLSDANIEIDSLKEANRKTAVMLQKVQARVIHVPLNVWGSEEWLGMMQDLEILFNENQIVNNIDFNTDEEAADYLDLVKVGMNVK